jgi:cell division septal protein FtsQ
MASRNELPRELAQRGEGSVVAVRAGRSGSREARRRRRERGRRALRVTLVAVLFLVVFLLTYLALQYSNALNFTSYRRAE